MKQFKLKTIAVAVASLSAFGAMAADPYNSTTAIPDKVVFVSGASAQAQAFQAIAAAQVCDTPANARWFKSANGDLGMVCDSALGGGITLVINRSKNGSAAGINQVLSNAAIPTESESATLKLPCAGSTAGGPTAATAVNITCVTVPGTDAYESTLALSDVQPGEFSLGVVNEGAGRTIGQLTSQVTALQGFGIIAGLSGTYSNGGSGSGVEDIGGVFNSVDNMYRKLQEQNVAEGKLPASCTSNSAATDVSADCQPSIKRAEYASLVSVEGGIKTPAGLLPNVTGIPGTTKVVVHRRVDTSGTQASSNIYFLETACKDDSSRGGNLTPYGVANGTKYKVVVNSETSDVRNGVAAGTAGEWTLGVISLDNADTHGTSTKRRWVKIDGVSPNFAPDGTPDAKQRNAIKNGSYTFAFEMTAMYPTSLADTAVEDAIITGLKDSTASNLTGIAYLDGGDPAKQARFTRDGNNCQGLK